MAQATSAELERPWRRLVMLVALYERRLKDRFFARAAAFYAWGIAVSYVLAMLFEFGRPDALLRRALGTLAFVVGGMLAFSAVRSPSEAGERGLLAFLRQRGASESDFALAQLIGLARRTARLSIGPAVVLSLGAVWTARDDAGPLAPWLALSAALVFVAFSSVVLALLSRAAVLVAPGRPRLTLLAFVALPHLAHAIWPSVPSVPAAVGALLDELSRWGSA